MRVSSLVRRTLLLKARVSSVTETGGRLVVGLDVVRRPVPLCLPLRATPE